MTAAWHAKAKAAHTKALASPQPFALTGDGQHTLAVYDGPERCPDLLGPRLIEARYRDWQAQGGLFAETRHSGQASPPLLELCGDELPPAKSNGTNGTAKRDERATMILRALADEFAALFPEEFAETLRYLVEKE